MEPYLCFEPDWNQGWFKMCKSSKVTAINSTVISNAKQPAQEIVESPTIRATKMSNIIVMTVTVTTTGQVIFSVIF